MLTSRPRREVERLAVEADRLRAYRKTCRRDAIAAGRRELQRPQTIAWLFAAGLAFGTSRKPKRTGTKNDGRLARALNLSLLFARIYGAAETAHRRFILHREPAPRVDRGGPVAPASDAPGPA